jgi:hypothetical protein
MTQREAITAYATIAALALASPALADDTRSGIPYIHCPSGQVTSEQCRVKFDKPIFCPPQDPYCNTRPQPSGQPQPSDQPQPSGHR